MVFALPMVFALVFAEGVFADYSKRDLSRRDLARKQARE
jgi:hypothetical protein